MIPAFRLYLITDGGEDSVGAIEAALGSAPAGSTALQLRAPGLDGGALYERARTLRLLCRRFGAPLLINDRVDVALAVAADGAHLPARGLPSKYARRLAPGLLLGASAHSLPEARLAVAGGADFVTLSPIWPTLSHPGALPLGLSLLATAAGALAAPVFALGGLDEARARDAAAVGARGACLRGVLQARAPRAALQSFLEALAVGSAAP